MKQPYSLQTSNDDFFLNKDSTTTKHLPVDCNTFWVKKVTQRYIAKLRYLIKFPVIHGNVII